MGYQKERKKLAQEGKRESIKQQIATNLLKCERNRRIWKTKHAQR